MAGIRLPRPLDRWVAFGTGRPASDGWQPSPRYRMAAALVMTVVGVGIVFNVAGDRGAWAALAVGLLYFSATWLIVSGRTARGSDFAVRHPYLDAAWSIPLAAVFALVLLPNDWPAARLWAIAISYVALIFALAWRANRNRRGSTR